ncbi:MAG: L-threonylcarbamoyladenylate synthase [Candidatus Woesebacteria bacterium]|nr:L-threonylcarbamoyladenylate synthase [Candidatus Woesebacteria bacterium]
MLIIKSDENAVGRAVEILKNGGLVIYATETLYGIGADSTNCNAVKKLIKYKNRPFGKPFSVAVTGQKMAGEYVELNTSAKNLYKEFLPGPLTIISKGKHKVARGVESEDGTLGIRIPDYKLVIDIVKKLGKPITATSANASYKKRPYKVSDILDNISDKQKGLIDLIIDAGELPHNEPSTVIDTTLDDPVTLRQGEIKLSDKNEVLSKGVERTENLAKELWQKYEIHKGKRAIVFALQGEMGTGKTIFTKGLARAMGITELVTSPTFALENIYQIRDSKFQLHHFDAWRLVKSDELKVLGFEDLIKNKSIVSIEWAERVSDAIREFDDKAIIIWVKIVFGKAENERLISWGNF